MLARRWPAGIPELSDGVLTLRGWTLRDAEVIYAACQDADIQRWLDVPVPFTHDAALGVIEDEARRWASRRGAGFAITRSADGAVLGSCTLADVDADGLSANVTCAVDSVARGQGIARQAVGLLCDWAFRELGLARLEFYIEPGNATSLRVAERLGCRPEDRACGARSDEDGGRVQLLFVLTRPPGTGVMPGG